MKKIAWWILAVSLIVFIIAWGVMGVKIFTNDYDITTLAYIGAACLPLILGSVLIIRFLGSRCPHCGKQRAFSGAYCPHCGRKIDK